MGFLLVLATLVLVSTYVMRRMELGRLDPAWRPPLALRLVAILLFAAWQLLRAWYVVLGAFFGVVILVGAYRLYGDGSTFEAVAFGAAGVALLVASFRWFAMNTEWRHAVPQPTLAELDENTLGSLVDAGIDVTQPVTIGFYLYFPTADAAQRAADTGTTPTLAARVVPYGEELWRCEFIGAFVPSLSTMHDNTTRFAAIAASLGGEYDGWSVVDDDARATSQPDPA